MAWKTAQQRRNVGILDAAEHEFQYRGFQQTTMEDVARESGVSVGTLYNAFQGKEDLYAQVAARVGQAVLERLTSVVKSSDPEEAVLDVIRLRLYNHSKDRLFFQPFCFPSYLGIEPRPEQLGPRVNKLHERYVDFVEDLFERYCKSIGKRQTSSVKMAVYLDGLITAFMGYWSGPVQSDSFAKAARQIRDMLFRAVDPQHAQGVEAGPPQPVERRVPCINRYDFDRLKELIEVVRVFGRKEWQESADALDRELVEAQVTHPHEVPPDVVTMNSRVRVRDLEGGGDQVLTLVFPKDMYAQEANVCILDPMGLTLFGHRVGDVYVLRTREGAVRYQVEQILYQPEATGDFHL